MSLNLHYSCHYLFIYIIIHTIVYVVHLIGSVCACVCVCDCRTEARCVGVRLQFPQLALISDPPCQTEGSVHAVSSYPVTTTCCILLVFSPVLLTFCVPLLQISSLILTNSFIAPPWSPLFARLLCLPSVTVPLAWLFLQANSIPFHFK